VLAVAVALMVIFVGAAKLALFTGLVIETVGGELAKAWAAKAINARIKTRVEEKNFIGIELKQ
jgi:hypothetical protein